MPLKVVSRQVAELHEDPANARRHPERNLAAIKASLAKFGQQRPIVVGPNNVVVAGNGTLAAARELGWAAIDCVMTGLKGVDLTGFAIADNRTAELAEWDGSALAETLRALQAEEFDLDAVGFSDDEVDTLLDGLAVGQDEGTEGSAAGPDPPADDGYVAFRFGDYSARVCRDVYDSFVASFKARQEESGEPMIDDVLRGWLGV